MIIKRYLVMCFPSALNPGAMICVMTLLNARKTTDKEIVRIIEMLMNVEYIFEYSSLSFKYRVQMGMRKALVAPEKKRVWISSGKLKATMKASTRRVAPKR
jgi:hypothetical protein